MRRNDLAWSEIPSRCVQNACNRAHHSLCIQSLASKAALFKSKMFKATSKLPLSSSRSLTEQPCATDQAVPPKKHKLKLLLLGDSGVGKTSLMRVFSGDKFSDSMLATAG